MTLRANRIERYYDTHDREGEELTQSIAHFAAIQYLLTILEWLFVGQRVGILSSVNLYHTDDPNEPGISPDIAVIGGLDVAEYADQEITSYYVGSDGPPPRVVIEISSKDNWKIDLADKPASYTALRIPEYFVFNPGRPVVWTGAWRSKGRLVGWRLNAAGLYEEIEKQPDGRLWSEQLASWIGVDGRYPRLYTLEGVLRVDAATAEQRERRAAQRQIEIEQRERRAAQRQVEAEQRERRAAQRQVEIEQRERRAAQRQVEIEQREKEAALQRVEAAQQEALQQIEAERREKEAALQRAEAEQRAKEEALRQLEEMAAKLRQLEQNPDGR
jgi:Uma2 family endonuclease